MKLKMKPILLVALGSAALMFLFSCKDEETNEDITQSVNTNGSVETSVSVEHYSDTQDILVTTHKVWVKQDIYKNIVYKDTIPALGNEVTQAENNDGEAKTVEVKKDYEIFITVK